MIHGDTFHAAADAKTGELVADVAKHADLAVRAATAADRLWHYQQVGHMAEDLWSHAAAQADECTHAGGGCGR